MNSQIRRLAPWIAAAAVLLLLVAGPGTRLGLWNFRTGFVLLRWGAYLGILAAGLGLVSLLWRAPGARPGPAVLAIVLGATAALVPYRWMQRAQQVPPIHDITTDVERPPEFQAVLPLRAGAANPAEYGGPEIAAQQQQAYPDVVPLVLNVPTEEAFRRALQAAQGMGWEIVAADSSAGRIEATATTAWFGFKDDVVVRVTPEGPGSRVDVRSVSRVGMSDVGANAARIREYLARLRK
ncbi:MAG: DUF1499 domain-containing protein [Gemmatimonadales bacterium]